jgi:hypothetical protein
MNRLDVPTSWSPEQALLIAGLLDTLLSAIWQTYGRDMAALLERDSLPITADEDPS